MREWPYTASNRDELGCTSPPTSRFPSALEMSLGLCRRDISRASGNLLVVGDVQTNTSLLSAVYVYNMQRASCMQLAKSIVHAICIVYCAHLYVEQCTDGRIVEGNPHLTRPALRSCHTSQRVTCLLSSSYASHVTCASCASRASCVTQILHISCLTS